MKKNVLLLFAVMLLMPWMVKAQDADAFPTLSEGGNDTWYSLYSTRAVAVMKDNGADEIVSTAIHIANDATMQWKFESTGLMHNDTATFKLVSKLGNVMSYVEFIEEEGGGYVWDEYGGEDGLGDYVPVEDDSEPSTHRRVDSFYARSDAEEGNTFIFRKFNSAFSPFQIWCVEEESYLNKFNPKDGVGFCVYSKDNDPGNPISIFTSLDDIFEGAPKLSDESESNWYFIKSLRQDKVFASAGITTGDTPETVTPIVQQAMLAGAGENQDKQLHKFVGDYLAFRIVCKTGGEYKYNEAADRFYLAEEGKGDFFMFVKSSNTKYGTEKWELKHNSTSRGFNETAQSACLWSIGDDGGVLEFVDTSYNPFEGAPQLSTAASPLWYTIRNCPSGQAYFTFVDDGQIITLTDISDDPDEQLFRFDGSYDEGFRIVNKSWNAELYYDTSAERLYGDFVNGSTFKFVKYNNTDPQYYYGDNIWQLQLIDPAPADTKNTLNHYDNNSGQLSLYYSNNKGNAMQFTLGAYVSVKPESKDLRANLSVNNNILTVTAEEMESISIYNIAGTRVVSSSANGTFEYTMPATGYYVISIAYKDAKRENVKFVVR